MNARTRRWDLPGSWGEPSDHLGSHTALNLQPLFAHRDFSDSGALLPCCKNLKMANGKVCHKGSFFKSEMDFIHISHYPYSFRCCCLCMKASQGISLMRSFSPLGVSLQSVDSDFRKSSKIIYLLTMESNVRRYDTSYMYPTPVMFL